MVVVAVTAAFLVGTTLLLVSLGGYTATLESDLAGTATVQAAGVEGAHATADGDDVVVPYAVVATEGSDDPRRDALMVGIPPDAPAVLDGASVAWRQARLPQPGSNVTGPVVTARERTIRGEGRTVDVTVQPHPGGDSLFPEWWYVANTSTVERVGATGAFVLDPDALDGGLERGSPLIGALPFLVAGVSELLRTLSLAVLAGALVIAVLVFSVSRMAIRDRRRTIAVARATGAPPRRLLLYLTGRGAVLTVVGVALGVVLGAATTLGVVRVADLLGVPVSLAPSLSPEVVRTVGPLLGALVLSGTLAAAAAARPSVTRPPGRLGARSERRGGPRATPRTGWFQGRIGAIRAAATPTILGRETLVPTTVALTVFVLVVLLLGAFVGSFAPLATTDGGTVIESGAAHPLNSRISVEYASLLREQGVEASPEVLYAQVHDGQPFLARGANYSTLAAVTDVRLVSGRPPRAPDEAVVGTSLARTLDLERGDAVTLGGSVSPGVRRVTIVGVYDGPHVFDDQLVLPLRTVTGLATGGEGTVHMIRTEGVGRDRWRNLTGGGSPVLVTGLSAPGRVTAGERYNATVGVRNLNDTRETATVSLTVANRTLDRRVELGPGASRQVRFLLGPSQPGTVDLATGSHETTVSVVSPRTFVIPTELPDRAPPGATLQIVAVTANGTPVSGATVTVGEFSAPTNDRGVAGVPLPEDPGSYRVRVSKPGYEPDTTSIEVAPDATRRLGGRLSVSPGVGGVFTRPEATVVVANPWGRPLDRNITLVTPGGTETRRVELPPGNVTRLHRGADEMGFPARLPPDEYTLRLLADGRELSTATYRVEGDPESFRAVAGAGTYARGTGISRAIEGVFGNVQVLFATMFLLAALSTVGATTATFARAVQTRRSTIGIYRATGASRRRVLATLVGDAVRLALPAAACGVVAAVAIMWAFDAAGLLRTFGVRLDVPLAPEIVGASVLGAVVLAAASAAAVGFIVLRRSPGSLLRAE